MWSRLIPPFHCHHHHHHVAIRTIIIIINCFASTQKVNVSLIGSRIKKSIFYYRIWLKLYLSKALLNISRPRMTDCQRMWYWPVFHHKHHFCCQSHDWCSIAMSVVVVVDDDDDDDGISFGSAIKSIEGNQKKS